MARRSCKASPAAASALRAAASSKIGGAGHVRRRHGATLARSRRPLDRPGSLAGADPAQRRRALEPSQPAAATCAGPACAPTRSSCRCVALRRRLCSPTRCSPTSRSKEPQHRSDPPGRELSRVLAPGGAAVLTEFGGDFDPARSDCSRPSPGRARRMVDRLPLAPRARPAGCAEEVPLHALLGADLSVRCASYTDLCGCAASLPASVAPRAEVRRRFPVLSRVLALELRARLAAWPDATGPAGFAQLFRALICAGPERAFPHSALACSTCGAVGGEWPPVTCGRAGSFLAPTRGGSLASIALPIEPTCDRAFSPPPSDRRAPSRKSRRARRRPTQPRATAFGTLRRGCSAPGAFVAWR